MIGNIVDRLLQKVTLLCRKDRGSKGERATSALIMRFVQPHNQTVPILGRFYRLYYDVHAVCLYKRKICYARRRYKRDSCGFLLTSHAHYRNIEFVGPPVRSAPPSNLLRAAGGYR